MATFFVDSTGVVTTASVDSDSIFIQSAALKGGTILGEAGADTINFLEGAATDASAVGVVVRGAGGNDSITISALLAFSAGNHSIYGGAGDDTIKVSGGSTIGSLKSNEGNDFVTLSGAGTYSAIGLADGADTIQMEQGSIKSINLGNGHDTFTALAGTYLTASTINFGKGNDTVSISASGSSAAVINAGDGKDSVDIQTLEDASTFKGGGGSDTINISGDVTTSQFIAGNGGADLISMSGASDGLTLAGGAGNDTIELEDNINGISAMVIGGSGDDSIYFTNIVEDDDYSAISVVGGAGADSITFSAGTDVGSGETLGTLVYSSFSDSDLAATDVVTVDGAGISGNTTELNIDYGVDLTSTTVGEGSAQVLLSDSTFSGNIASNIVTLSGDYLVSSVTAVAGTVDTLTFSAGANASVIFSVAGGTEYLFVQGGSSGTSDDSIINLGDLSGGGALALGGSAAVVTFSGQA